jgi:hypothetical protein
VSPEAEKERPSMKLTITIITALACSLAGCGDNTSARTVCGDNVCDPDETAASCAEDCGCGNGVANPGEDCDGSDLGDATCESVAQRGGTLGCNADCTFDVAGCNQVMCGNGIAEPGEACDGSDLGGASCQAVGFSGGQVACNASCGLDLAACCNNFCDTPDSSVCVGNAVHSCSMQASGCLGLEITDCAATGDICNDSAGAATCACIDRCAFEGQGICDGAIAKTCVMGASGCLSLITDADCATTGEACAIGPQGSTCVSTATGESCGDPYPLVAGQNVVAYAATAIDHLTTQPSCNSSALTGPDVVLSYTAAVDGIVTYSIAKSASQRHVVVASAAACGTLNLANEVSCVSEFTLPRLSDTFAVTAGTTYFFYVRDTTNGTALLPSPLIVDVDEAACASLTNGTSNLSPANGAVLATTSPVMSVDFQHPVNQATGVITITGNLGTARSFDLSTAPAQVTFTNGGRTMRIDPATSFLPGETITISWSGLVDKFCAAPIAAPTWTFAILTPSCTPGVGGMVGTTTTRLATGISSFTEQYVAADTDPAGFVYVGGLTNLFRVPKAGGTFQNVNAAAGITSSQLGNAMAVVGSRIFTLETVTSSTSPFLFRLSSSGGVTWNPLGYGRYPATAGGSSRAVYHYKGRLFVVTDELTASDPTEIYSVSANAISLPETAVFEGPVSPLNDCDGLAVDDHYFYLTCDDSNDHIVRVDRTTFQPELITAAIPLSLSNNELHAHDLDGDGRADVLYVKTDDRAVHYICDPGGAPPFWTDVLVRFGAPATSNFGLGFDPVANTLWAYDDGTQELISIQ